MSNPRSNSDALELLVEPFDDTGSWDAVLYAAGVEGAAHSRSAYRRPRLLVALVLLALIVALLATPALGVQALIHDLFDRKSVSFPQSPSAPNLVKKQFLDLSLSAPRQWQPGTIARETRVVGTFTINGHRRRLWVAPTRRGGYCFVFELSIGGCRATRADRAGGNARLFSPTYMTKSLSKPGPTIVERVAGDIDMRDAASLTVHYADGGQHVIPFVWVSKPIAAGFFTYDIPTIHWTAARRAISVTAQSSSGRRLATYLFPNPISPANRPAKVRVLPTSPLPAHPTPAPSDPVQHGRADGITVAAGRNGSVQFTALGRTPATAMLTGHNADYVCFRLTSEFGIFTERTTARTAPFEAAVGLDSGNIRGPFDGCEIQGTAGHLWPDKLDSHSAVEVPFTPKGAAFFADRAAARDLGLFVRARRVQKIRHEPPTTAVETLKSIYRTALAHSRIRMAVRRSVLTFSERSTTGRTFRVEVRHGKIIRQNLAPYALAF